MAQQQANRYDAIVIGGGGQRGAGGGAPPPPRPPAAFGVGGAHNGLVPPPSLAKHGARTVVLEKRHKTGGAADTSEPWPDELPGVHVTTLSYVMSLMPPSIPRDLQLV